MKNAPPLLWLLTFGAIALLAFLQWFFAQIRKKDNLLYEKLGSPDLISNNNYSNVVAFWRWVFGESFRYKGDTLLLAALWFVRAGSVVYVLGVLLLLGMSV